VFNHPQLNLKLIIDALIAEDSTCDVRRKKVKLYDMDAWEFLSFARQDLEEESEKGRINALSNAKRAIGCRADEILILSNLKSFSSKHRWGLPYKMLVLKTFGVSAPDVLMSYIASKRNLLEHEYTRPKNLEETRYLADITELFLSATDKYIENGYIQLAVITRGEEGEWQKINKRVDKRINHEYRYVLKFDLQNEALAITHEQFEVIDEYDTKTALLRSKWEKISESNLNTVSIRDSKEGDVRELMKLLNTKGKPMEHPGVHYVSRYSRPS